MLAAPKQKSGLVMFANSANGLSITNELVGSVMGNDHPALVWLNLERYNSQPRLMLKAILKSGAEKVLIDYRRLRAELVARTSDAVQGDSGASLTGSKAKDQSTKTKEQKLQFDLSELVPSLCNSGAGALAWWSIRETDFAAEAAGLELHNVYRRQRLSADATVREPTPMQPKRKKASN